MSLTEAVRSHRSHMLRYARRLCGDDATMAEDVVQDVFAAAVGVGGVPSRQWLMGTVRHVASHHRRPLARYGVTGAGVRLPVEMVSDDDLAQQSTTPGQELRAYVNQLQRHFSCLGPAQQNALRAAAVGADCDAAARMALSVGRKRLRQKLGISGDDFLLS